MGKVSTDGSDANCKQRKLVSVLVAYGSRVTGLIACLFVYQHFGIDSQLSNGMGRQRSSILDQPRPDEYYLILLIAIPIILFLALSWRQLRALAGSLVFQSADMHSWPPMRAGEECCKHDGFRFVLCLVKAAFLGLTSGVVFVAFWIALHHLGQSLLLQSGASSFNDQQVIGNFIEWFGVLYGLIFAAVLVEVWSQFKSVEHNLDREADDLLMLYETAQLLDSKYDREKQTLIDIMSRYAKHVMNNAAMEYRVRDKNSSAEKKTGDDYLRDLRKLIRKLPITAQPSNTGLGRSYTILPTLFVKSLTTPVQFRLPVQHENDAMSYMIVQEMIQRENDLFEARGDRISSAQSHLPIPLQVLLTSSSVIWLMAFFGLPIRSHTLAVVLVAGVAYIILSLFEIVADLNNPYIGVWRVDMSPLNDFITTVNED